MFSASMASSARALNNQPLGSWMTSILLTTIDNVRLVKDHIISTLAPGSTHLFLLSSQTKAAPTQRKQLSNFTSVLWDGTIRPWLLRRPRDWSLLHWTLTNNKAQVQNPCRGWWGVQRKSSRCCPVPGCCSQRGHSRGLHTPTWWTVLPAPLWEEVLQHHNQNNYVLQHFNAPSHPSSSICYWAVVTFLLHFLMHHNCC